MDAEEKAMVARGLQEKLEAGLKGTYEEVQQVCKQLGDRLQELHEKLNATKAELDGVQCMLNSESLELKQMITSETLVL